MPAKATIPNALGGAKPSLDEPETNRAMKDFAMAHSPRNFRPSRHSLPPVIPAQAGIPEAPAQASEKLSQMTRAREILFLDPGVSDLETLLSYLRPEVDAILLDP